MREDEVVFEGFNALRSVICGAEASLSGRTVGAVYFDREKLPKKQYEYAWLNEKAKADGFELVLCGADRIAELASTETHGGIVGTASPRKPLGAKELSALLNGGKTGRIVFAVEGIEDPYNLGFLLRSVYAFGCDTVLLPPSVRFGADSVVCRASAGASERMHLAFSDLRESVSLFRAHGYRVLAAAEKNAVSLEEADLSLPLLLLIGGEKRGLSSSLFALCDGAVRIDYARPVFASLSAASAAAVLAYESARRNGLIRKK
ncbi:MAG: hypothetical protein IJR89_08850 [Clostridia bacterium]|nr:hypothetical protein [Clostridia bacterium]